MERSHPDIGSTTGDSEEDHEIKNLIDEFEENLGNGEIPLGILNSKEVYEAELERIFGRTWVFVGHETEVPEPGDYRLRYIGDNPFIFVRDEQGEIRLLFDSCRHRGAKLCRGEKGNTSHFRCPYHGWTYKNTGELIGVPKREQAYENIDRSEFGLFEPPHVDSYGGLVFASLDPDAPSLKEYLGDAIWYLDLHFEMADMHVVGEPHRWEVDIDWKTLADNSAGDNYHLSVGHQSAMEVGIGSNTATEQTDDSLLAINADTLSLSMYQNHDVSLFWGYPDEVIDTFDTDQLSPDQLTLAKEANTTVATIFPNLSLHHGKTTHDPDKSARSFLTLRLWRPLEPGKAEIWNWFLVPKDASDTYKREAYEAGVGARSASGGFMVDDIGITDGIADVAGTSFVESNDMTVDYSMGMYEESESDRISDWSGPGVAFGNGGLNDANQLHFYENWYKAMATER